MFEQFFTHPHNGRCFVDICGDIGFRVRHVTLDKVMVDGADVEASFFGNADCSNAYFPLTGVKRKLEDCDLSIQQAGMNHISVEALGSSENLETYIGGECGSYWRAPNEGAIVQISDPLAIYLVDFYPGAVINSMAAVGSIGFGMQGDV